MSKKELNAALLNALGALKSAGANSKDIPAPETVLEARKFTKWFGQKSDGSFWMLVKRGNDSYNVVC